MGDAPTTPPGPSSSASASPDGETTPPSGGTASPTPTPTSTPIALPTDCRAILSQAVLDQFADVPLNDPAFDLSGPREDGSLLCVWGDPAADTTNLTTEITRIDRGPALDMLNMLVADEGFTCFAPDGGTRCEKTWQNTQYPVTDGRTLFWRDSVLIDTRYSNLAPDGYTSSIIEHVFG
ncbi:hypothetical protein FM104_11780 [Microbacterium esteraromaticum]|uniref:Uncharacterized protein n=2 Tax=Microbacterium esteraromaticum TaxID=57043 RepID=A0A1R4KDA0_9MICO|nr:hypothetical protein FM104_11780 [Microbacterium esteraromaticum]